MATGTYKTLEAAARAYGAGHGVTSRKGGWLYRDGVRFIQGWRRYGKRLIAHRFIIELDAGGNEPADWREVTQYRVIEQCGTIGCRSEATEEVSYFYRGQPERETMKTCTPCAEGYARRPVLIGLTRVPLDKNVPVLQQYVDGWTALNSKGTWRTLRPASAGEIALQAEHPGFWLRSDGTSYYALGARSGADQLARVTVPADVAVPA